MAGFIEGLEFSAPDAALLELSEPRLDERLTFGIAVAAAAVRDPLLGERGAERAAGERGAVVGAERQVVRPDAVLADGGVDDRAGLCARRRPSPGPASAATMRVPSVGLARATSSTTRSVAVNGRR